MATMGKYCKAYSLQKLRTFRAWSEKAENARKEKRPAANGTEVETSQALTDADYLYLQENYVVTDGIFKDANIIFEAVTPEWRTFCQEVLQFEIPSFAANEPNEAKA